MRLTANSSMTIGDVRMAISGRKEKILKAVVERYIVSCEPISSSEIRDENLPELSSATIRNELAALEEMGYLAQPHTSAGRVPTAEAYRLYVDKLMPRKKLSSKELKLVKQYFSGKITEIDDILKKSAKLISEITDLTGVAVSHGIKDAVIENIKIVKLADKLALVIIVTDQGVLKDGFVELEQGLSDDYFTKASAFISGCFRGYTLKEIDKPDKLIRNITKEYERLFNVIYKLIRDYASGDMNCDVVLEGSTKLLNQPEYSSVDKAKTMLELLETKNQLVPLIDSGSGVSLNIKIGKDENGADVPDCAVVSASYSVGGVNIGNVGVIGPMRMNYAKVVSVLDYIGKAIEELPSGKDGIIKNDNNNDVANSDDEVLENEQKQE